MAIRKEIQHLAPNQENTISFEEALRKMAEKRQEEKGKAGKEEDECVKDSDNEVEKDDSNAISNK